MNQQERLAAAFIATFAVIVVGAAVVGFVAADGAAPAPSMENEHYTDEDLVNDRTPGEADVSMSAVEPPKTVLVDTGAAAGPFGDAGVSERDIRPLSNVLIANGHEVSVHSPDGPETIGAELDDADAFVTFRSDYAEADLDEIESFADDGNPVVSMTDPDEAFGLPGNVAIDSHLGVSTEPGYVYNLEEHDMNYQRVYAEPDEGSDLTEDVDRVVFPTATPVEVTAGTDVLRPSEGAQLSTTRAATDKPVLVQDDNVIKIGTTGFMTPENAQRADNDVLIGNLADVLVTSPPGGAPQPPIEEPPTEEPPAEELPEELIAEEPPEETPDGE